MHRGTEPDRRGDDTDRVQRPPLDEPDPQAQEEHGVRVESEDEVVHVRPPPPEAAQEEREDREKDEQRLRKPGEELVPQPLGGEGATVHTTGLARLGRSGPWAGASLNGCSFSRSRRSSSGAKRRWIWPWGLSLNVATCTGLSASAEKKSTLTQK